MAAAHDLTFEISHFDSSITFEATRRDFIAYKLTLSDEQVVTATQGNFSKTSVLLKNVRPLFNHYEPGPVLTSVKEEFGKKCLKLIFFSEPLETTFTLTLCEVEANPLELLTKRVRRLEEEMTQVVYEATTTEFCQAGQAVKWTCLNERDGFAMHSPERMPVVNRSGRYQIIVSLCGKNASNGKYLSAWVGGREVARSYCSDNTGFQKQHHLTFFSDVKKGEAIKIVPNFSQGLHEDSLGNRMTVIYHSS